MPDTAIYHGSYLMPSLEHATVSDAMHPGILSCEPDANLSEVARMMARQHVHCIVVAGTLTRGEAAHLRMGHHLGPRPGCGGHSGRATADGEGTRRAAHDLRQADHAAARGRRG